MLINTPEREHILQCFGFCLFFFIHRTYQGQGVLEKPPEVNLKITLTRHSKLRLELLGLKLSEVNTINTHYS